jgi:hypothetical protein
MITSIISETDDLRISRQNLRDFYSLNQDLFTPSPKLQLIKLSFDGDNMEAGVQARALLVEGNIQDAKLLAENDIIRLPNVLLPAMKIREYIGPSLTQVALDLREGEVSQLIELDGRFHLLVSIKKMISNAPLFDDVYQEVESEYIRFKDEELLDEYLEDLRNWYDVVKANEI